MKPRRYTTTMSFLTTPEMYNLINSVCIRRQLGIGELIREVLEAYLKNEFQGRSGS